MHRLVLVLVCAAGAMGGDLRDACTAAPRQHVEAAGGGEHRYTVRMGGSIDGDMTRDPVGYWAFDQYWEPNLRVRLENAGDVPVVNPWLRRADRPDTRSARAIADFLLKPSMSDEEKARRLWEFEIRNRFHATTSDEEVDDLVKRFNAYGYTLCGNESKIMSDLWRAAGLRVRKGYPNGHSTAEVYYGGAWHLLDSDESIICLLPDNRTIASEAQIVADHDLMKRVHTYGPLHDDDPLRDQTSAALVYWEGERSGEQPSLTRHTMDFVLRPHEAITWAWHAGGKFHNKPYPGGEEWTKRWRLPAQAMDGDMSYAPDLTRSETLRYVQAQGLELRSSGPFGAGLYGAGSLTVPVKSAYPIVGGNLEVDFSRANVQREQLRIAISFDQGKTWRAAGGSFASDYARLYLNLDASFAEPDPARYEYLLRIESTGQVCLRAFRLHSTLQMARLALPGVSLGDNAFIYTDASAAGAKVRITHEWRECDAVGPPGTPAGAVHPSDGGTAEGTRVAFRWQPVSGAADYEFELSEYSDVRWELSPNFRKLVSHTANRGTASYELSRSGFLNPGQPYYWRVRARSHEGVWGPWSKVWKFSAVAPAVPVNVHADFDRSARKASLGWEPGAEGSRPTRYRVYGSTERGFTASDVPYRVHEGLNGIHTATANLLIETLGPVNSVELPAKLWRPWYRVVAVDAAGRESGVSQMAELPHPLIATMELPAGTAGAPYEAKVALSSSRGHLVSADENGKAYQMKFRAGDEPRFELSAAPAGLSIDPLTGVISGRLPTGKHSLTVVARDARRDAEDRANYTLVIR